MTTHDLFLLLIGVNELRLFLSCPYGKIKDETGLCVDCPKGYFGRNCSKVCSDNTYGAGCRKNCSCIPEFCDPEIGCILQTEAQSILHLSITLATVGLVLIMVSSGMFCRCVRKRRQKKEEGVPRSAGILNDEGIDVRLSENPFYAGVSNSVNVYSSPSESDYNTLSFSGQRIQSGLNMSSIYGTASQQEFVEETTLVIEPHALLSKGIEICPLWDLSTSNTLNNPLDDPPDIDTEVLDMSDPYMNDGEMFTCAYDLARSVSRP